MATSEIRHNEGDSPTFVWNKSCVACSTGKRKCDGLRPCSRCIRRDGGLKCTYQKRKVHKAHKPHKPQRLGLGSSNRNETLDLETIPDARREKTVVATRNAERHMAAVRPHGMQHAIPKLKRFRLGASPATGLVGTQENYFLNNFFDCLGMKPLASESEIRATMVKIMSTAKKPKRVASHWGNVGVDARSHWFEPDKANFQEPSLRDEDCSASAPSTCAFWSAIAIGALLANRSTESVESYVRLAKDALGRSVGSPVADQIRAWVLLAGVDAISGDLEAFNRDHHCAETLFHECKRRGRLQEIPLWLIEMVEKGKTAELLETYNSAAAETFFRRKIDPAPEINAVSPNDDIYIFLIRIDKKLEQAMYTSCITGGTRDSPEAQFDFNGNIVQEVEVDHSAVVQLRDKLSMVEPLGLVVQRPTIRTGIGGLLMNMTLAVAKAAKRDDGSALEHLRRAAEVLERFPGILRLLLGSHIAHRMVAALAALADSEAREQYERVRATYNRIRPSGFSPIPPFEEWQGVHFLCNNPICRVIEALCRLPSRSPGSTATAGSVETELSGGTSGEKFVSGGDLMNSESLSANDDFQMWPINEIGDDTQRSAQENDIAAALSSPTPDACGDEVRVATAESLSSNTEYEGARSTFEKGERSGGSNTNTNSNECLSTEENEAFNVSPLRVSDGMIEDQAMMMMMAELQQEGWADDSFIGGGSSNSTNSYNIDISPEDWLQVAKDALPSGS